MILKRDYKYISDIKIRSLYLKILSKHTGVKHVTVAHSSLSKVMSNSIKSDLEKYLKLNPLQSEWLINSHTKRFDSIKEQLLKFDPTVNENELTYYHYLSWAYQIKQNANYGYTIFSVLALVFVVILSAIAIGFIESDDTITYYVFIPAIVLLLVGMIFVYQYNIHAYKMKNDSKYPCVLEKRIHVEKIKPQDRLVYFRRHIDYSKDLDSLIIYFKEDAKIKKIIYPLTMKKSFFSGKTYKEYRHNIKNAFIGFNTIDTMIVTYNPNSKVVYKSSVDLERILSKRN